MANDVQRTVEESNSFGQASGIEVEAPTLFDEVSIGEPFNPDDIDVATRSMTIDLLLSRIKSDASRRSIEKLFQSNTAQLTLKCKSFNSTFQNAQH
jgi:hypothetical protein